MKLIGYDAFQTIRIRYKNGAIDDIACLAESHDNWWQGDWHSYIFNLMASMRNDGAIDFTDWESAKIICPDWNEEGFILHEFTIYADDSKLYHEIHDIKE